MDLLDVYGLRTCFIFSAYGSNYIEKSIKTKDDSHLNTHLLFAVNIVDWISLITLL